MENKKNIGVMALMFLPVILAVNSIMRGIELIDCFYLFTTLIVFRNYYVKVAKK